MNEPIKTLIELVEGDYYVIIAEGKPLQRPYKYNGVSDIRKGDHFFVNENGLMRVGKKLIPQWIAEGKILPA
jgi:hypothetical protein